MKLHYYGPITTPKIIRTVYANIHNDNKIGPNYITKMVLANTAGNFKLDDVVFQGRSVRSANAQGIVIHYSPDTDLLTIGATQGTFVVNNTIRAASTNGVAQVQTLITEQSKVVEIKIEPDPITAQPGDDYGYTTTITEWVDT